MADSFANKMLHLSLHFQFQLTKIAPFPSVLSLIAIHMALKPALYSGILSILFCAEDLASR